MIDSKCWKPPAVFTFLQKCGIKRPEMFRVFNMGIGYVIIVRPRYVAGVMRVLQRENVEPMVIGQVTRGTGRVEIR